MRTRKLTCRQDLQTRPRGDSGKAAGAGSVCGLPSAGRSRPPQGSPAVLARWGLYYVCNHFPREMKQASNESPLSMPPINNGLRSCWYSSSAYFTAGLAGNLWRPCEGSIGCRPEERGADLSPRPFLLSLQPSGVSGQPLPVALFWSIAACASCRSPIRAREDAHVVEQGLQMLFVQPP
jgi:hypothetical protein